MVDKRDWSIKNKGAFLIWLDDSCFFFFIKATLSDLRLTSIKTPYVKAKHLKKALRDLSPPFELCTPQRVRLASISTARLNSPISFPYFWSFVMTNQRQGSVL